MATSAFEQAASWSWHDAVKDEAPRQRHPTGPGTSIPRQSGPGSFPAEELHHASDSAGPPQPDSKHKRRYPPRTCRICLETVNPTHQAPSASLPGILNAGPSVSYVSSDPTAGRLIRPCKCKGSSRYVHEGCLQTWRHADPAYGERHYWQCPTCGFKYRLERMKWASWISSKATQVCLTVSILFLAMFLLGFVADPIINLYLDPYTTISSVPLPTKSTKAVPLFPDDEPATWIEHFVKGLASLGLLSFIKVLFAMSPWQWWNLRSSGIMSGSGRHAGASGRDRLANISWIVVMIGVGTFLWGVWKGVSAWSRRTLEKAGERVMDVHGDEEDDEFDEDEAVRSYGASEPTTDKAH